MTLACAHIARADTTVEVQVDPPSYDALQSVLDEEASTALAEGRFKRAWQLYWHMLVIDPSDLHALRETGRIASALGHFTYAADALGRVDRMDGELPDPELHYIRGEALFALGKKAEAEEEFQKLVADLGDGPKDRQQTLWLARVEALHGDTAQACARYGELRKQEVPGSLGSTEILLLGAEAHILAKDWAAAERVVRQALDEQPDHQRAHEMLAWILEGRDNLGEELQVRAVLADDWSDHPRKTFEYARALERAYDYDEALDHYKEARSLGVAEASDGVERLEGRMAPELGGGYGLRNDPTGTITSTRGGVSIGIDGRVRMVGTVNRETTSGAMLGYEDAETVSAATWGIVTVGRGSVVGLGATAQLDDLAGHFGASAFGQTSPVRRLQAQVRADYNQPWRESAATVREGGSQDVLSAQVFATPHLGSRLLFSVGGVARRLGLEPLPGMDETHATQLLASAGFDVTLVNAGRAMDGEMLDDEMLNARSLASAAVVSFRHYEMSSDDPFGQRLVLVERASVDEVSGVIRKVVGGRIGGELRGGVGYDGARETKQWRAGASLLVAATRASRFTLDYDVATESGTGLVTGRRHFASAVLHVDL